MNDKRLIDILYQQLKDTGKYESINIDRFSDGSGMWIEAYKITSPDKNLSRISEYLNFSDDGQILLGMNVFKEQLSWDQSVSKQIS